MLRSGQSAKRMSVTLYEVKAFMQSVLFCTLQHEEEKRERNKAKRRDRMLVILVTRHSLNKKLRRQINQEKMCAAKKAFMAISAAKGES